MTLQHRYVSTRQRGTVTAMAPNSIVKTPDVRVKTEEGAQILLRSMPTPHSF